MKLPIILLIFYLKIPEATSNLNTTISLSSQSYNSSINKSFQVRSISNNNNNNISRPSSIKQYADKLKTFQDVALINSEFIYLASTNGVLYQFSKNSKINNNNLIAPINEFHYNQLQQQHTRISTLFNLHSEKLSRPFVVEYCLINNKNNFNKTNNPLLTSPNLVYKYFTAQESRKALAENAAKQKSETSENGQSPVISNSADRIIATCHSQNFNRKPEYR